MRGGPFVPSPNPHHPTDTFEALAPNPPRLALSTAFQHLRLLTHDHPPVPIKHAFNWRHVARSLAPEDEGRWFLVVFRSVRRHEADTQALYDADARAHAEALQNGSLLAYHYGTPDTQRRNIAMCIWSDREAARAASQRPLHRNAAGLAHAMYETFTLERWWLTKEAGKRTFKFSIAS